jgi:hypothetical protein
LLQGSPLGSVGNGNPYANEAVRFSNYPSPVVQWNAMSNQPAQAYTANQWQSAALGYKQYMGASFSRDSTYNGLWTKAAQLNAAQGNFGRYALDQAAGVALEAGVHAQVGVAAGAALGTVKLSKLSLRSSNVMGPNDGPQYIPQSPIDYAHVLGADYSKSGVPTGGHSLLNGDVRIVPGTESAPNAVGVYRATVEMPNPAVPGAWITKPGNNHTMFPDWSRSRLQVELDAAWLNRSVQNQTWAGQTPSGVQVRGWVAPRTTVYPLY